MKPVCIQVNWQRQLGGGEIYTRFFTEALQALGWETHLVVDRAAPFWHDLGLKDVHFIPIAHGREIPDALPADPTVIVTHTVLPPETAYWIAERHRLAGIVHMPLIDRDPRGLEYYHRIFAVSGDVRDSIRSRRHQQVADEPLLGVADLRPRTIGAMPLVRRSEYDWDKRKFRDRLLSWVAPLQGLLPHPSFSQRSGLTLGIVSRLTPIKQLPTLFSYLAPILAGIPRINLEIFGSGGYASVRDLKQALAPLDDRVRFWGHQPDPASVYPRLDYVLSGLPEREALGLNLIEAQTSGTPVIAVAAAPFTETVVDRESGFLYTDPRQDNGKAFAALMHRLVDDPWRPDPRQATAHLAQFSVAAFQQRVGRAMASIAP